MLNVFRTDDGMFHQAVLSLNKLVVVRLVVEKLALKSESAAEWEWEWMAWRTAEVWDEEVLPVSGREASLHAAKRRAFDAGMSMLTDLTQDRATGLPAIVGMRLHEHWRDRHLQQAELMPVHFPPF